MLPALLAPGTALESGGGGEEESSLFGRDVCHQGGAASALLEGGRTREALSALRAASRLAKEEGRMVDAYACLVAQGDVLRRHAPSAEEALSPIFAAARVSAGEGMLLPPPRSLVAAACVASYELRDAGRPLEALSVLQRARAVLEGDAWRTPSSAHGGVASSEGGRGGGGRGREDRGFRTGMAHLLTDICNIQRGLGRLEEALGSCEESVIWGEGSVEASKHNLVLARFKGDVHQKVVHVRAGGAGPKRAGSATWGRAGFCKYPWSSGHILECLFHRASKRNGHISRTSSCCIHHSSVWTSGMLGTANTVNV